MSTGAIPSVAIAEDLLTIYQKDKAVYIKYFEERLSQITSNSFLHHYNVLILKHFPPWTKRIFVLIAKLKMLNIDPNSCWKNVSYSLKGEIQKWKGDFAW